MTMEATFTGARARKQASAPAPFGPAFSAEVVDKTETLEVLGSGFNDSAPDFCEFRALDANGVLVGQKRMGGC